ncbi:MAG: radical SAM protein [Candidatus Omnitrophota bacterium]
MANLAYIQITRTCNQDCRFCSNPVSLKTITFSEIKNLINQYVDSGFNGVVLSGGEPTCYEQLPDVIQYAKKKKFLVKIITNGQKTSVKSYLAKLLDAGLNHISISVYSDDEHIQGFLTNNFQSLQNIKKTLQLLSDKHATVDILTTISKYNANHLDRIVKWLVRDYGFLRHFVWNNLDPSGKCVQKHPDTIPRLIDFEVSLYKAMYFLQKKQRSFRAERVPLCYMTEFADCSTETRKIVKKEVRATYFLDEKGLKVQKGWRYKKGACCKICSLDSICSGLYSMDEHFSSKELFPVFIDKIPIMNNILTDDDTLQSGAYINNEQTN